MLFTLTVLSRVNLLQCVSFPTLPSSSIWHHLPGDSVRSQGYGLSPTACFPPCALRTPFQMSSTSPSSRLCFWLTVYKLEVPMMPSLGLINLLDWLTEVIETGTRVYQAIIKESINDTHGQADEEVHRARYVGRVQSLHVLGRQYSPQITTFSLI